MKAEIEIDEALWAQIRRDDAFGSDAEALTHLLAVSLDGSGKLKVSTALILATGKVRVKPVAEGQAT